MPVKTPAIVPTAKLWRIQLRNEQEPNASLQILAVHSDPEVRGALYQSFPGDAGLEVSLAPTVEEARDCCSELAPAAVLLPLTEECLKWAAHLRSRFIAPVVLCFFGQAGYSLCEQARGHSLQHFVELPEDAPAAWAAHEVRIASTLHRAIAEHAIATKSFHRSTQVMDAVDIDRAHAEAGEIMAAKQQGRHKRETLVRSVPNGLLESARDGDFESRDQSSGQGSSKRGRKAG